MAPNQKPKPRKSKKLTEQTIPPVDFGPGELRVESGSRFAKHFLNAKLAFARLQGKLPNDLGPAFAQALTQEPKQLWGDFYREDVLGLGKAATKGEMASKRRLPRELRAPFANFLSHVSADIAACPTSQDRAVYILKVATLFVSSIMSVSAALNMATFGFARNKLGRRPWAPSFAAILGSRLMARLLEKSLAHLPEGSEDRRLAEFLKANFEIFAFGGSLGVLEAPSFLSELSSDPAQQVIQQLMTELFEQPASAAG